MTIPEEESSGSLRRGESEFAGSVEAAFSFAGKDMVSQRVSNGNEKLVAQRGEGNGPALVDRTVALGHRPRVYCFRSYRTTVRRRVAVNVSPSTRTK